MESSSTSDPVVIEELTAYLDGELADDEIVRVEKRLATDTGYRLEMQRLQRTWDLLDKITDEHANDSFTKTTMELVVNDAVRDLRNLRRSWWHWPAKVALYCGLPLLLMAGTYGLVRHYQQKSINQLLADLPVIVMADRYSSVRQNLVFLEQLDRSGLFSDESVLYSDENDELVPERFASTGLAEDDNALLSDPLATLDSMDTELRVSLRAKRERFNEMTPDQRLSLHEFHNHLNQHPRASELLEVLDDYYYWMDTLSETALAEHNDLPLDERLSDIGQRLTRLARLEFGRAGATELPSRDARAVFDWYEQTSSENQKAIQESFVNLVRRHNMDNGRFILDEKINELKQYPLSQLIAVLILVDTSDFVENLLYGNINKLRPELSDKALGILDGQDTNAQKKLLVKWIQAANQTRETLEPAELQRFYEELPVSVRDELDKMAVEQRFRTLKQRFRETQLSVSTPNTALPDEQSTRSLIKDSGLEEPDLPFDETGIPDDIGMPIDLELPFDGEVP